MCGIAGFCNMPEQWQENIHGMNERMRHRGPDAEGVWASEDASVVMGHRRLAIIDLSPFGAQPMISASGRSAMVLNGEIYNYQSIAGRLTGEKKIAAFRGHSDTEVLLEAVEAYGFREAVKMTRGMFAVAFYDRKEKKLFLARDRMGEKPLYYGFLNGRFVFASDIAAIRDNLFFEDSIDRDALALYFRYGYLPAPYTIYRHIRKLEAGSIAELSAPFETIHISKYWDVADVARDGQSHLFDGSQREAADELDRLLREAVRGQMAADVPVGAFLSGGIDSTAVAAVMQSLSGSRVKTFTIGFENSLYDEARYAGETARYLGTEHTEFKVTDQEAKRVIPELPWIFGEPFADSSQIPTLLVSRLARQQVTVSLSGDGGDELFCGYNSYGHIRRVWGQMSWMPLPLRRGAGALLDRGPWNRSEKLHLIGHYLKAGTPEQLYEMTGNAVRGTDRLVRDSRIPPFKYNQYRAGCLGKNVQDNMMLMDQLMYHPDDILVKVDRSGMAVSLESRIPFLDKDVVEFAWRLPLSYKYGQGVGKRVLRDVLYRYVPQSMMDRPKKGFAVPVLDWIRSGDLRSWAEDLLEERKIREQGILDEKIARRMWRDFLEQGTGGPKIWYLLMFQEWMRHGSGVPRAGRKDTEVKLG